MEPEAAIIDATLLADLLVIHASAHKALKAQQRGTLRTKTVHAEIVVGLSGSKHVSAAPCLHAPSSLSYSVSCPLLPSNSCWVECVQIGETLSRFGIKDASRHLIVARLNATAEELQRLRAAVAGQEVPLKELAAVIDVEAVRKQYKILDEELSVGSMVDAIVSRVAAFTGA